MTSRRDGLRAIGAIAAGWLGACGTTPDPKTSQHFVLVHGAWSTSAVWSRLAPHLRAAGHRVTAIELPGRGRDSRPSEDVTLASYASAITDVLKIQGSSVVLVGHSLGGMAVSQATEYAPDMVRTLVFLTAFVMGDGETTASRRDPNSGLNPALRFDFRPGTKIPLRSRLDPAYAAQIRAAWFPELPQGDADQVIRDLISEPAAPAAEKLQLSAARFGRVDKVYIQCSRDGGITPSMQRNHASKWPMRRVLTLEAGHWPMLSMPERLSRMLTTEI